MNQDLLDRYILLLYGSSTKDAGFDGKSLNILEQFAWEKYLSAYQIYSNLKSTYLKMGYKNVNKRINVLLLSGLIQKPETDTINSKHSAIYYRLTEYGIYQLFLNKLNSLLVNQSDVRKGTPSNALSFFQNYSDSMLFETFLYPYFKKDTLLAIGSSLLTDLYGYLSSCCHSIERKVKHFELSDTSILEQIFSWNKIPGKDNDSLMLYLQRRFNLESIEPYDIKKEDALEYPTITVNLSSAPPIVIRLDKARNKVIMMSRTSNDEFQETEYEVHQVDEENVVSSRMHSEESTQDIINDAEKLIEQLIYEFVYRLASSATEASKEFSYYRKILSQDEKFMKVVEQIYKNRHKGFEAGYKKLRSAN
jgi:hypothetical protein